MLAQTQSLKDPFKKYRLRSFPFVISFSLKMTTLLFLSLYYILLVYIDTIGCFEQRYLQGSVKTVPHYKLIGHQIKNVKVSSLLSCAHACLAEPRCVSTNFGISDDNKLVCELNNRGISVTSKEQLTYEERFVFSLYSSRIPISGSKDACKHTSCLNQGQCYFNHDNHKFQCKCSFPWTGDSCQTKTDIYYNFTSLGATGRFGPTSNAQYQGTSLEGTSVQNGLQTWSVPVTGEYQAELCGASGADNSFYDTKGGRGARIKGSVHLQKGTKLTVLVGQKASGGGGGGGTFVVFAADGHPLAVAEGGGAADAVNGDPGQDVEHSSVNGGGKGNGGNVCVSKSRFRTVTGAGGGGGLITDGRCFVNSRCNGKCPEKDEGKSFTAGGRGGFNKEVRCAGGFGGGGNCGGGGGYSGGGVQVAKNIKDIHAGGGGSFVPSGNWTVLSGGCPARNGFAIFELVSLG